jgi:hypothetical protein
LQEGYAQKHDPKVAQIAGCSDHIIRTYVNEATGVLITAMVLYGNAEAVSGHTPEVCYPAAGYRMVEGPATKDITVDGTTVSFRSSVYTRNEDGSTPREEVFYSFRHQGRWFADVENHWKVFRHRPSMYKIQTQRRIVPGENREHGNPTDDFLAALLSELEHRLAAGKPAPKETAAVRLPNGRS